MRFIFVLLLLINTPLYSQSDSLQNKIDNSIQLFLVNDISAGYNHMLSDNSALNISVDIGGLFYFDDVDYTSTYYNDDTSANTRSENNEFERQEFSLIVLYKLYFYNDDDLRSHLAAGPLLGYGINENVFNRSSPNSIDRFERTISIGISLNSGIEMALTKRLLLLAEYRLDLSYSWILDKYISYGQSYKRVEKEDVNRRTYNLMNLRIGIGFRI